MEKSTSEITEAVTADPAALAAAPDLSAYDLANSDIPTIMNQWFQRQLRMRWLELLTEFGATNLFFVSGDSLVLEFLREAHVRWGAGESVPHLLHLTYAIEQFLRQMIDAGCVFRIVFFKSLRSTYANLNLHNESADGAHGAGALLARDMVLKHLKSLDINGLDVDDSQDNWWDSNWAQYLDSESPGFVLTSPLWRASGSVVTLLRTLILQLYSQRISLAFLGEIKFSDNRIYTFCWEPYDRRAEQEIFKTLQKLLPEYMAKLPASPQRPYTGETVKGALAAFGGSWRSALTAEACKHLMASSKDATVHDLVKIVTVQSVLLKHLTLQERSWRLPETTTIASALSGFFSQLSQELDHALFAGLDLEVASSELSLTDIFDWRVFSMLLHCLLSSKSQDLSQIKLPENITAEIKALWVKISDKPMTPLFTSDVLKPLLGTGMFDMSTLKPLEPLDADTQALPVRSPITDAILGDLKPHLPRPRDYELQKSLSSSSQKFFADWHWHSGRKITLEESSLTDDGAGAYGAAMRNTQSYLTFVEQFSQSLNMKPSWKPRVRTANPDPDYRKKIQADIDIETTPVTNKTPAPVARRAKEAADELQKLNNLEKDSEGTSLNEKRRSLESFKGNSRSATLEADFKVVDLIIEQFQTERDRTFGGLTEEQRQAKQLQYATDAMRLVFDIVEVYQDTTLMTPARKKRIVEVATLLGLFDVAEALGAKLQAPSSMVAQLVKTTAMKSAFSSARFQLRCMGPYMERDTSSIKDPRVPFLADEWQVKVLDGIDKKNSLLVVAPTSAGKTFISFYAMERVLKDDEFPDGIVVYVAPTKALVNQVAAEVYAQFAKAPWLKAQAGIQTYGVFTRDYRFFPTKCRVLVTVPQCLEILLLSPTHFSTWRKKLRYVIFDEIHSINQEEGSVWERLVAMVPCPAIALSATIGESEVFAQWLGSVAKRTGHDFQHIVHPHRFSDLQKNLLIINPKENPKKQTSYEIDVEYLHPWATFTLRQFAHHVPPDVALSPRDCLELYIALEKAVAANAAALAEAEATKFAALNPDKYFAGVLVINQRLCRAYEKELKAFFNSLIVTKKGPLVASALDNLGRVPLARYQEMLQSFTATNDDIYSKRFMTKTIPETLLMLKRKGMLPAICFNFERKYCEDLAITVGQFLEDKEKAWRQSPEYLDQVRRYNKSLEAQKHNEKMAAKQKRQTVQEQMADAESMDQGVNPADMMHPDCSFTTIGEVMSRSELDADKAAIGDSVHPVLVKALRRGVGVHHAGLHKRYLQVVERYFRAGQLKVVFATGTLALGINMPCRTTLFLGDSNFLTPLQYRQMSGRAGRRGFDPVGNVVFMGIGPQKIRKLEASSLPILRGHFPFTTSFLLRTLVLGSNAAASSNVSDLKTLYLKARKEAPAPAPVAAPVEEDTVDDWELLDDDEPAAVPEVKEPEPVPEPEDECIEDESLIVLPKELQNVSRVVSEFFRDPLFCLQRNYLQEQVQNHVRFSLEFLVRAGLINLHGEPINLAGIVTHLSYTEPANFVICELLTSNAIHQLCARANADWASVSRALIHIMSSLFCRLGVPQSLKNEYERLKDTEAIKPHQIILPALPADIQQVLDNHELNVRRVYVSSVMQFVRGNLDRLGADHELPLSKMVFPTDNKSSFFDSFVSAAVGANFDKTKINAVARSAFVALSGWDDHFTTATDLSSSVRSGVYLPPEAMPSLDMTDISGTKTPLNAFILDMWNWTNREWLEHRNHIRDADAFAYMKEFLLTLKAISVALQRRVVPAGSVLMGQDLADPVANAFRRLADDFEDKFAKLYGTRVVRRFVMRLCGFRGDLRDFRKIPIDKEINKKTLITIKNWRFGVDEQHRIILKIEARSAQDLKDLADKQHLWLQDNWRILEVRKETKDNN